MDDQLSGESVTGFLGVECGATRTVILFEDGARFVRKESGPANVRLLNDAQLSRHFRNIRSLDARLARPTAIGIGMAGARSEADRERIRRAANQVWRGIPSYVTNDLETAMMAAEQATPERKQQHRIRNTQHEFPRVLVLS